MLLPNDWQRNSGFLKRDFLFGNLGSSAALYQSVSSFEELGLKSDLLKGTNVARSCWPLHPINP